MPKHVILAIAAALCCLAIPLQAVLWNTHFSEKFNYMIQYPSSWEVTSNPETGAFTAISDADRLPDPASFSLLVEPLSAEERKAGNQAFMNINLEKIKSDLAARGYTRVQVNETIEDYLEDNPGFRFILIASKAGQAPRKLKITGLRHAGRLYSFVCEGEEGNRFVIADKEFDTMVGSFGFRYSSNSFLDRYVRVRADLGGSDTVFHWTGKVYGLVPGEKRKELFALEGFSVVRAVRKGNGFDLLSREAAVFKDHRTGEILETWRNPYTGKDDEVFPIFLDPVNQDLGFDAADIDLLPMILPSVETGNVIVYYSDIFPFHPNPLPRKEFPLHSQSDNFQAGEFIQYIVQKSDLSNPENSSVPAVFTWTEICPWLPFMKMGDRPGNIVIVARGAKLPRGISALPEKLRQYVLDRRPEFAWAPDEFSGPNATIWTEFRKQLSTQPQPESIEP